MNIRKSIAGIACLIALANCGSSDETPMAALPPPAPEPAVDPITVNAGTPTLLTIGGTQANPTFTVDGRLYSRAALNPNINLGLFAESKFVKQDYSSGPHFLIGRTNGGYVAVGAHEFLTNKTAVVFSRTAPTQLITSASAQYEGDYAGLITERNILSTTDDVNHLVTGDVSLTANFDASIISGTITNRVVSDSRTGVAAPGYSASDVTLVTSTIGDDGVFSAASGGGALTIAGDSNGNGIGTYSGAFVGPNSDAVIGSVTLTMNPGAHYPQQGGLETGAFIADKQ